MSQSAGAMRSSRTSSRHHHHQLLSAKPTPREVKYGIYLEGRRSRVQHRQRTSPASPSQSALMMSWTYLGDGYGPGFQGHGLDPGRIRAPNQSILEDPDLIMTCPWKAEGITHITQPLSPRVDDVSSPWVEWFQGNPGPGDEAKIIAPPTRDMLEWTEMMHRARQSPQEDRLALSIPTLPKIPTTMEEPIRKAPSPPIKTALITHQITPPSRTKSGGTLHLSMNHVFPFPVLNLGAPYPSRGRMRSPVTFDNLIPLPPSQHLRVKWREIPAYVLEWASTMGTVGKGERADHVFELSLGDYSRAHFHTLANTTT
ncbi:hypothetical protein BJ684DRAFT_17716 [Piptocephalis cylindrospora]|uniref:Uncharacterized protein n=1 Tax=Piptocephalis cylindrospora TaxID=1907219 RepID=A0A4P9XZ25_9FUNG|nr:hypothetical protein BJ684DRAFT_17716 [Piptocephalis cylindrospora]|eukprot:RKP11718.1 hypothetical protein BJ684DRAFT_17716 [Piptocephalis cylindrospora]